MLTDRTISTYTSSIDTADHALERVRGKGRSLAKLALAQFKVPDRFLVTTSAYREFIISNILQQRIIELARPALVEGRLSYQQASTQIRSLIESSSLADAIAEEVTNAYRSLPANGTGGLYRVVTTR